MGNAENYGDDGNIKAGLGLENLVLVVMSGREKGGNAMLLYL